MTEPTKNALPVPMLGQVFLLRRLADTAAFSLEVVARGPLPSYTSTCVSMVMFESELVKQVQALIDGVLSGDPVLTNYKKIMHLLRSAGIAYDMELMPSMILVSPKNRGGLGINAHDVHKKGAMIVKVGADKSKLHEAVCFEMHADPAMREVQYSFNRKMVDSSGGLLAPVAGNERFVSVGCGHTTAFCRACLAGCKTNQNSIADGMGCLDMSRISRDDELASMVKTGWAWTVLPFQCEDTWPGIADIFQRALNASNNVGDAATELEVASSIAAYAGVAASAGESPDWNACVAAATAGAPSCSLYADVLAEYCRKYGGGRGSPMVFQLDAFAKKHSMNLKLGQEFWTAVVETEFSESNALPRIRNALLIAQLTSPKHVDGVAKMLTKSDVSGLVRDRKKVQTLIHLEKTFGLVQELVEKLIERSVIPASSAMDSLSLYQIRCITFVVGKAKQTFEGKQWDSLEQIMEAFYKEINSRASEEIPMPTKPDACAGARLAKTSHADFPHCFPTYLPPSLAS